MKKITLSLTAILMSFLLANAQQLKQCIAYAAGDRFQINDSSEENDILSIRALGLNTKNNSDISENIVTIGENQFLTWDNNGADLNSVRPEVIINLSSDITPTLSTNVSYTTMERIWKVEEFGGDIPLVNVTIPQEAIINTSTLGNYYMFTSESESFDSISDYRIMTADVNGYLETQYDFDNTTYITFGFAPQITEERSIFFNGISNYVDVGNHLDLNPLGFTISAWIKPSSAENLKASIVSKRDMAFTQGYDFSLYNDKLRIFWKNDSSQSLISNTSLPSNEWHHVAVTYDGNLVSIYIDGVLDNWAYRTAPIATQNTFLIAAAAKQSPIQYFDGHIDEVRIWNIALSKDQLRFIMNQEIVENSGYVNGKVLPTSITKNDINAIPWTDLAGYYSMSKLTYRDIVDDSGNGNNGKLINLTTIDRETAPLPYKSKQNGDWESSETWSNGDLQFSPGSVSIVDPNTTIDWNIVDMSHNLTMDNSTLPVFKDFNRTLLALMQEENSELILSGDNETLRGNGLTITHYLKLGGKIDLDGESQLIQTEKSDLEVSSNGQIERDQQGTADKFTYNYWSSPVTKLNSSSNSYRITDIMKDGTLASEPLPIHFLSTGYDGAATHPIRIADYWIWKYANHTSNNYSAWQHIRRTGNMLPGEGFTMKGPGTGPIGTFQNYVFIGKPNNGDINLTLAANNDYLVGNPYPSAIDANKFILDNGPQIDSNSASESSAMSTISGTLYFWKHWGGESHILQEYKGGYATYNFSGAVAAASFGSDHPDFGTGGEPTKRPERYISVGQGFFVTGENGGTINFNNGQRIFKREINSSSVFMRGTNADISQKNSTTDDRMKFRIGFNSINTIRRQLLLTIDENASSDVDWAYDAKMNENQVDDMFWMINEGEFIIQASNEAEASTIYPIGIRTSTDGLNSITIDDLENVPDTMNLYVHDTELNYYHNLGVSDYEFFLSAGEHLNRFALTFSNNGLLGINEATKNGIDIIYANSTRKIILVNPNLIDIQSVELYNLLGQSISSIENIEENIHSEYDAKHLSTGTYIINLHTADGSVLTKKVVVR